MILWVHNPQLCNFSIKLYNSLSEFSLINEKLFNKYLIFWDLFFNLLYVFKSNHLFIHLFDSIIFDMASDVSSSLFLLKELFFQFIYSLFFLDSVSSNLSLNFSCKVL